jgi:GMP synthase-like glutamine amidotransferase
MHVLIVKHLENEDAGTMLDYLHEKAIPYKKLRLYAGDAFPQSLDDISHLVVLGGTMNVYEEDKFPYLKDEDVFIKRAISNNIPYFGICLGAQLLCKALGERVYKADHRETGVMAVTLSDIADPDGLCILKHAPKKFMTVQWHGDTFDIPAGGSMLASSDLVRNQAFVVNGNAFGMQFHLEVTEAMVRDWFKDLPEKDEIISDFLKIEREFKKIAWDMYEEFYRYK